METDEQIHKKRNWVATVATIIILVLVGLFVWRILFFMSILQKGDLDLNDFDVFSAHTTSAQFAYAPIPEGEFDVVTEDDPFLGNSDAPLTIVEFADFSCPYSRDVSFVIRRLVSENPGKVRFIYRNFPLTEMHSIAQFAAEASECAHEQNVFWQFHDKLFQNQNDLSEERIYELAQEVGVNQNRFRNCMVSNKYADEVQQDLEEGFEAGVRGTPTFFINGNRIVGAIPEDIFEKILKSVDTDTTYAP